MSYDDRTHCSATLCLLEVIDEDGDRNNNSVVYQITFTKKHYT